MAYGTSAAEIKESTLISALNTQTDKFYKTT